MSYDFFSMEKSTRPSLHAEPSAPFGWFLPGGFFSLLSACCFSFHPDGFRLLSGSLLL
jgi:hypothetical protein